MVLREYPVEDTGLAKRWDALEDESIESNPFLSRHFVIPAYRHLGGPDRVVVVESVDPPHELHALAVVESCRGHKLLPAKCARLYRSQHTFLTGLMVQPAARHAVELLLRHLTAKHSGLELPIASQGSELHRLLDHCADAAGLKWFPDRTWDRAAIRLTDLPRDFYSQFSKSRRKSLRRSRKRLESAGTVGFELKRPIDVMQCITTFKRLEAMGWKGEQNSAIGSNAADSAFFEEMIHGFASQRRVLFAELSVNHEGICSSVNLLGGSTAFAFKIGWNPAFADAGPGIQCELEMVQRLVSDFPDITDCDSCSTADSYLNNLWPDRVALRSGIYISGTIGKTIATALSGARRLKRCLKTALGR
ncbi:MAG: GNAT family N-acetyltransferase [Planctomycetota bacterium]|nr:GNAT family N-acetyltransferase [Planctomycetota bacterium]